MKIDEYIKSKSELMGMLEKYRDRSNRDIVESSDLFKYDDIIDDDDYGPNTKVIYINGNKETPWPIIELLETERKDVDPELLETYDAYLSQYNFESPAFYNFKAIVNRLSDKVK